MVAGAVKSAVRVAQWPDGWLANHQLWVTGTYIAHLFILNAAVTAWVVTLPL